MNETRRVGTALAALAALQLSMALLAGTAGAASPRNSLVLARAVPSAGAWAPAEEVPGTSGLNAGGNAAVTSVSCASPGNCAAGGAYVDSSGHYEAFVVNEVDGVWKRAEEVPYLATLNAGGYAYLNSVSCVPVGSCAAVGIYEDASGDYQAFVVNEARGAWGDAEEVPGTATINAGGYAYLNSVSCTSAASCAAGGYYEDGAGDLQAFVVDESGDAWGRAEEVPGTAALNAGGNAFVSSVSCSSPGNCVAGGGYAPNFLVVEAFVSNEVHGVWRRAEEIPGSAGLNPGGNAAVSAVSCTSIENCGAGGVYVDSSGRFQAFVVDKVKGEWRKAEEVPGLAVLNSGGDAAVNSVSCSSAGNCAAGGGYEDRLLRLQAFVVHEVKGVWEAAQEVPGLAAFNEGGDADVYSVSCSAVGSCAAGGLYENGANHHEAFLVDEAKNVWGDAEKVLGSAVLNTGGDAAVNWIACVSAGNCAGGGSYTGRSGRADAFVVSYSPRPSLTRLSPDKGRSSGGTIVTILGKNLLAPKSVRFGQRAARIERVVSTTKIEVISPEGSGTVAVSVTTAGGTSLPTVGDHFRY